MENKLSSFILFSSPWQRIPFFKGLPLDLIQVLLEGAECIHLTSKTKIFNQGEEALHFGFVVEGLVRLSRKNSEDQRIIMDFAAAGAMIGGLLMAHEFIAYPVTAQATMAGLFLKIPKSTFSRYWLTNPEVVRRTQIANSKRMEAIQATREIQKFPLDQKIARILLLMSPHTDTEVLLKISKTDLADAVGACVESVIRIFSQWQKEGLITLNSTHQETMNIQHLQERYL